MNSLSDNSLNILYVFGSPLMTGGHIKSALAMVRNLKQTGYHTVVMAAPGGDKEIEDEFTNAGAECLFSRKLKRYWKFPAISGFWKIINICREKSIDVIHAQDVCGTGRSYLAASVLKKPFVFTQPGGPLTHHIPPAGGKIVLFSEELFEHFQKISYLRRDNIHLIRARIDRVVYKPSPVSSQFIEKYKLPQSGMKIVMALRLIPQKSSLIETMLEAAQNISRQRKDVHFVVAGEGSLLYSFRKKGKVINDMSGYGEAVKFIGNIESPSEMNNLYNYADIVIGHGRGILEAMACEKPVVILGEKGEGEAVRPDNVDEIGHYNFSGRHFRNSLITFIKLSDLIGHLLNNEDERIRLGKLGLEYISGRMDARLGTNQLLEVYRDSLKSPVSGMFSYCLWHFRASVSVIKEGLKRLFR